MNNPSINTNGLKAKCNSSIVRVDPNKFKKKKSFIKSTVTGKERKSESEFSSYTEVAFVFSN